MRPLDPHGHAACDAFDLMSPCRMDHRDIAAPTLTPTAATPRGYPAPGPVRWERGAFAVRVANLDESIHPDSVLQDKVALVTGANNPQGLGAAIAAAFAAQGASAFMTYPRQPLETVGIDAGDDAVTAPARRSTAPETPMYPIFASEQARWITGQRLFVGGGHRV